MLCSYLKQIKNIEREREREEKKRGNKEEAKRNFANRWK